MVAAYTPHRSRTQAATPAPARSGPFRLSEPPSALVRPVGGPRQGPPTGHCGRPDRCAAGTRVKEGRRQRTSPRGCGFPFVLGSFRTADDSGGTYGSPKNWIRLVRQGWRVSVNTIAKIMAELGLVARKVCRRRGLTRPGKRSAALDFVRRDFTAEAPNLVLCGDMTEIETGQDKLYLATVIDLFSRRLLGYAMGARHDAELVVAALHMAAATLGGEVRGVIFYSDRGSEVRLAEVPPRLPPAGHCPVQGRVGSCFDCFAGAA
ncbi:DDE-type integrase/transposase/recombinase [Streptomyces sp. NPDC002088]|uniref:DDE-type integrase/transposase/recombinase n=1 Tax=Streptomyces sp. NPDC002088 TaxID=3154665 RepID=UPI00332A52AC